MAQYDASNSSVPPLSAGAPAPLGTTAPQLTPGQPLPSLPPAGQGLPGLPPLPNVTMPAAPAPAPVPAQAPQDSSMDWVMAQKAKLQEAELSTKQVAAPHGCFVGTISRW